MGFLASTMALRTVEGKIEYILQLLSHGRAKTVVLVGQPGVGKTWMARELIDRAAERGLFDITLWLFLNREYDSMALCQSFAQQLYLLSTAEEFEDDDYEGEEEEEEMEQDLRQKMSEALAQKHFLIILDDEGKKMKEKDIMPKLETLLNLSQQSSYKVLITTNNHPNSDIIDSMRSVIEVEPLSKKESKFLLQKRAGTKVFELSGIEPLVEECVQRSTGLPAEIVVMGKALSYIGQCDSGLQKLEIALEEVAYGERFDIALLLRCGFNILPGGILIDCCRPDRHFFQDSGCVHYNELIAYWMMEGYLGQVDCIEKAYNKGYHVLKELIDFHIVKTVEPDYVVIEGAAINLQDCNRGGFGWTANLGLSSVFRYGEWEGLGRITQVGGIIRSLSSGKKGRKLSTLLLDGNRIGSEIPDYLLQSWQDLHVLVIFNPTFKSLPRFLSNMDKLNVLVLRNCHFLEEIDYVLELRRLTALEISGPSSFCRIPDDFFRGTPSLRSLNLSALQIESLPKSFYELSELSWLILGGCSYLKELRSLRRLINLVVIDLSGSTSLSRIQDKSFSSNKELQMINFSKTNIKSLPLIFSLKKLTHLLLSGCLGVDRHPGIRSVTTLQIIDLSDACNFKEFHDQSLANLTDLKILDLSRTAVDHLPSNISNPHHLYLNGCTSLSKLECIELLKDLETLDFSKAQVKTLPSLSHLHNLRRLLLSCCSNLEELPDLNSLTKLEVLDLSGCSALTVLQDKSFEQMPRLWKLDLSETKIKWLPSLSNLSNLRHLLLKKCTGLRVLPPLESLSKLELNLCGIRLLRETGADFLNNMSCLRILDLSETLLQQLPSMSNLKTLHELYLKGCPDLTTVPGLKELTKLEVLDLSETAVDDLPSLDNFSNLRQLLLRDCPGIKEFLQLEMLNLLGATLDKLPYGISELTHLDRLDLPSMKDTQGIGRSNMKELYEYGWDISSFPAETVGDNNKPPVSVTGSQFLQLLENNPSLWKTSFKQFHFSVHPFEEQDGKGVLSFYRDDFIFRDIYFKARHLSDFEEQRSLEIRGFHHSPKGIEDVLSRANCLFLIDNAFERWLSDLGASNCKVLKSCFIDRSREMESVFHEKEVEEIMQLEGLEVLWVSNSVNLKHIYPGNWQSDTFENLKQLYLDCCPKLSIVFSSSQLPKNLQVLQIEFCDELNTVFEGSSTEPKLPNLDTLYLWELPKLKGIGCSLPSLLTQTVWGWEFESDSSRTMHDLRGQQTMNHEHQVLLQIDCFPYEGTAPEGIAEITVLVQAWNHAGASICNSKFI
ncbi:unnamed protein product [Camellia sinensis]